MRSTRYTTIGLFSIPQQHTLPIWLFLPVEESSTFLGDFQKIVIRKGDFFGRSPRNREMEGSPKKIWGIFGAGFLWCRYCIVKCRLGRQKKSKNSRNQVGHILANRINHSTECKHLCASKSALPTACNIIFHVGPTVKNLKSGCVSKRCKCFKEDKGCSGNCSCIMPESK